MKALIGIGIGLLIVAVVAVGGTGIALLTGAVDFAATTKASSLEARLARYVLDRSIERRAPKRTDPAPSSIDGIGAGLSHYRANCLACHGAPGVAPFELAKGLNPPAPDLSAPRTQERPDGELFWIVRHGIRMSGMPAFQPTHSDDEIWALIGAIRHLPRLMPEERAFLESAHEAQEHRHEAGHADESSSLMTEPHEHPQEPALGAAAPRSAVPGGEHRHAAEPPPAASGMAESQAGAGKPHAHAPGGSSAETTMHHGEPGPSPGQQESAEPSHHEGGTGATGHKDAGAGQPGMGHDHGRPAQEHADHDRMEMGRQSGLYGPYPLSREASGTAWQPDRAAHEGLHGMRGAWMYLVHGFATGVFDHQGGKRGDDDLFGASMLMGMASRPVGSGVLGFRAMISGDPVSIGKEGYPLLLQTGETADGREPLIDRQHPHDLWMELAASMSVMASNRSAFVYLGMPGEPALGPPAFMHRWSGLAAPLAPVSHHWLDSTHITFGVATLGLVQGPIKLEGSLFTGREPDEKRFGWDTPQMDSRAVRVSYNPSAAWSLQASMGHLESPEQLHPDVDVDRTTASVMYSPRGSRQVTLAWGRNHNRPGHSLDMFLVEAAASFGPQTIFARAEAGKKDELFGEDDPRAVRVFRIGQASGGYIYEVATSTHTAIGIGGSAGISFVPDDLVPAYGDMPFSGTIFARARLK
jgi:mono/diheme cytochrome c family protein